MVTKDQFLQGLSKTKYGEISLPTADPRELKVLAACMPKGRLTPAGFIPHFRCYGNHIKFVFDVGYTVGCWIGCVYCYVCPQDNRGKPAVLFFTRDQHLFVAKYMAAFSDWFYRKFGHKCQWLMGEKLEVGADKDAKSLTSMLLSELKRQSNNWNVTHYTKHPGQWMSKNGFIYSRKNITWLLTWTNGGEHACLEPRANPLRDRVAIMKKYVRHNYKVAVHAVLTGPREAWQLRRFIEENHHWIEFVSWTMYKFKDKERLQHAAYSKAVGRHLASNLKDGNFGTYKIAARLGVLRRVDAIIAGTQADCNIILDRPGVVTNAKLLHKNTRGYYVCSNGLGAVACPANNARINGCDAKMFDEQNQKSKFKGGIPQVTWNEAEKLKVCAQVASTPDSALMYAEINAKIMANNLKVKGRPYQYREDFAKVTRRVREARQSKRPLGKAA